MNATYVLERVRVAGGGRQIASQVGTHLVGGVAQFLGLPSAYSAAMEATVQRTFDAIDATSLDRLRDARSAATGRLLEHFDGDGPVVLAVDASLFEVHSEHKEGAIPHFKGGFGFHPMAVSHPGDLLALLDTNVPHPQWLRNVSAATAQPYSAVETSCSSQS